MRNYLEQKYQIKGFLLVVDLRGSQSPLALPIPLQLLEHKQHFQCR